MGKRNVKRKRNNVLPIHIACMSDNKGALKSIVNSVPRRMLEIKDGLGRTPLIITVYRNFVEGGAVLLKAGVTVDNTDNAGQTALHIAACNGFHQFVKLLLSFKASWIQRDFSGATALHMAAVNPNVKGLAAIIRYVKSAEIDIQDSTLKTPLHWSAAYAYNNNIKALLSHGANTCIPDEDGKTPLHWVVANPNPEALDCVKTLLKEESSLINWQDYSGLSPLHITVACGSEEVLYFLASRENCTIDLLDNSFCTPLHCAAKEGFSEKADILLKKRACHLSVDDDGATALHYASHNNHAETVQVFCSKDYIKDEADKLGRKALMWAAIKNAEEALKILAVCSRDLSFSDINGYNALHAAAIEGHVAPIELLVQSGLSIDLKDKYGMTAFLKSCEFGRSKAVQALIHLGANINETDINDCSALHWCAKGGHAYVSQILIKCGADYNIKDSFGKTPLHYASSTGDFINCTCVLVESGADPNLTDNEGMTPIHLAVLKDRIGIVGYLCHHDANVNPMFMMDDWYTPLDCALLKGNEEIVDVLKKYGAVRARDIKEYAAKTIQRWFRKKKKMKYPEYQGNLLDLTSVDTFSHTSDQKCMPISGIPTVIRNSVKNSRTYHSCKDCFHEIVCKHSCKKESSLCIPISEIPTAIRNPGKNSGTYHTCNGCFHEIVCKHVCKRESYHSQNSIEDRAAVVLQKVWRKYILKKRFANLRSEVAAEFSSDHDRLLQEELWRQELENFCKSLEE